MTLPSREELLARIEKDAAKSCHEDDYVDGATPWANLALEMAKALEEISAKNSEGGLVWHRSAMATFAVEALVQFQAAVKGEEK